MSWIECHLEEVASISSGFAFKSKELSVDSGTPVIKIKNINDRKVYKKTDTYLPSKFYSVKYDKYMLKEGDILVAMTGQGSVGRIGKMSNVDRDYLINQRVGIIKAKENICDDEFLFQLLATPENEKKYFNLAQGAGQPNLSPKDIGSLEISIPTSLETQKRIASILSAYDDLIENNLKRIKLLEETAQNIYKEWFVNFRFPNYENTPINQETGLPEGWEKVNLYDFAEVKMGFPFKAEDFNEDKVGIPAIRIRDIPNNWTKTYTTQEVSDEYFVEQGDILIGMDGFFYLENWGGQRGYLVQRVCRLRALQKSLQGYLIESLREPIKFYEKTISGATVAHLGAKHLKEIYIALPSDKKLLEELNVFNRIFSQKVILLNQNQKLKEARDILLPRLMNRTVEV